MARLVVLPFSPSAIDTPSLGTSKGARCCFQDYSIAFAFAFAIAIASAPPKIPTNDRTQRVTIREHLPPAAKAWCTKV
jgi:hypothetical protein